MRFPLNLALIALIVGAALLLVPAAGRAATIACDGNILDCTPCCGSSACVCTDNDQCRAGSFYAVTDRSGCERTGVKFTNSSQSFDSLLTVRYWFCVGICIGPDGYLQAWEEVNVPRASSVSIHIDEIFPWIPDPNFGIVEYVVDRGSRVSVLTSQTSDCSHYTIHRAESCIE